MSLSSQQPELDKPLIGRRYLLHEQLGEGGMGTVYRAIDRLTGQIVALKQVITGDAPADDGIDPSTHLRIALAQEFKVLASLRHPNVIGVLDYGFAHEGDDDTPQPYFTMELVANPETVLEAGYQQPLTTQVDLLLQMLQALAYLHRRGIIHRDLKPNNALVTTDAEGNKVVKVLDFGLSTDREEATGEQVVGTLTYIAPEMLQGKAATPKSDLYAVGVIAYEMLAGHHPFDTSNTTRLIRDILTTPPNVWALDINEDLVLLLEQLLHKNPEYRYENAEAVIVALCEAMNRQLPQETKAIRESFLQAAELVGRTREVETLSRSLARVLTTGKGSAWLIGGESGVGKSRLVDELRTLALVEGALVLRGQAISEGGHPYQLWRDVLRWMALLTDIKDLEADALKTIVPDLATLLGRDIPENTQLDAFQARDFLLSVVEDLFRRFTVAAGKPNGKPQSMLVILEDLHWAPGESLLLLRRINALVEEMPLMVVASYRDDERFYLPTELPDMQVLKLDRLATNDIEELSAAMLGNAGRKEEVVEFLQRETEGNIFFLVEVVRALAEEAGRLGQVGEMILPMGVFSGGVQNIVQWRLGRVPDKDHPLLRTAAVLGRWLDLDVLRLIVASGAVATSHETVDLDEWLTDCVNVAVLDVQEGRWRFAHDKLRDILLQEMSALERQITFQRVAEVIEQHHGESAEQAANLAYYWGMAGNQEKELAYATKAGKAALAGTAFLQAVTQLDRAAQIIQERIESGESAAQGQLAALKEGLGQAYFGLGETMKAQGLYEDSLTIYKTLEDQFGIARTSNHLGDVAYAQNDYDRAEQLHTESAALAEKIEDRTTLGHARADLGRVAYIKGEYKEARELFNHALVISQENGDKYAEANLLDSLGSVAHDLGDYTEARRLCLESVTMCEALGDRQGMAAAYIGLGNIAQTIGNYAEAESRYQEAIVICETIGDRLGLALATQRKGDVAYALANYPQASQYYHQALIQFGSIGDKRGSATTLTGLGNVARMQRDYAYAKDNYDQALSTYRELGDRRGIAVALNNLGNTTYALGEDVEAWRYYRAALKDGLRMGVIPLILDVLDGMAGLLVNSGDNQTAAELIGFILNHPSLEKQGQNFSEQLLSQLKHEMTPEALTEAQAKGREKSLQAIVEQMMNAGRHRP